MAQSAKGPPTLERTTGGRTFRASFLDDLTWSVSITGGDRRTNAVMEDDFAESLNAATESDIRSGEFGPWAGDPLPALFATAAARLGWDVVNAPAAPGGKLEPGVVY